MFPGCKGCKPCCGCTALGDKTAAEPSQALGSVTAMYVLVVQEGSKSARACVFLSSSASPAPLLRQPELVPRFHR